MLPAQGLPEPSDKDAFVKVVPFETGLMSTLTSTLVEGAKSSSSATSWRFFIHHNQSDTQLWFDMGISSNLKVYPESVQKIQEHFQPTASQRSLVEDTRLAGSEPSQIKYVIASHAHWDHVRPLPSEFSSATMICGPGATAFCGPGHPQRPGSPFDGRIWDQSLRTFRLQELPCLTDGAWNKLGPFPHAIDFFNDGSFYVIDAPGHLPGNLAALAKVRTRTGGRKWALLGGDCAPCNLFTYWPSAPFGKIPNSVMEHGTLHHDAEAARKTIDRIAQCKRHHGDELLVWYAHSDLLEGVWDVATIRT